MEDIKKKSLKKMAEHAKIKSLTDDCYDLIRQIIQNEVENIYKASVIIQNNDSTKKTLLPKHVQLALDFKGRNFCYHDISQSF